MKPWKIIVFPLLITLAVGGIYLFSVYKHRQDPGVTGQQSESEPVNPDDLVEVRDLRPADFKDVQRLAGTTVWVKNGSAIPYFAWSGGRVQFDRRIGLLSGAQQLNVKKVVQSAVPADVDDGVSHGSRQAFVVFALPTGPDLFAMPVGAMDSSHESYFTDVLFYYDDPRKIYDWPPSVWNAIEAHRAEPGMTETAAHLALGRIVHAGDGPVGDRAVTYDQGGKHWTVTFEKNYATTVKAN